MQNSRPVIALMLAGVLTWSCSSDAMFESFKNKITQYYACLSSLFPAKKPETPQKLKPFGSNLEAQTAFRKVKMLEEGGPYIVDYDENYSISQAIHDIEVALHGAGTKEHEAALRTFLQRLFLSIVKEDIEKKLRYTIVLGLTIEEDGSISMKYLPAGYWGNVIEQQLLLLLNEDSDNRIAHDALKFLLKNRKNSRGTTSALLPKISLVKDLGDRAGDYSGAKNTIEIVRSDFTTECCSTMLHEWTHRFQWLRGMGNGAFDYTLLSPRDPEHTLPRRAAMETEADLEGVDRHPDKKALLADLGGIENLIRDPQRAHRQNYPYLTAADEYLRTLKNLGLLKRWPYRWFVGRAKKIEQDRLHVAKNPECGDEYGSFAHLKFMSNIEKTGAAALLVCHSMLDSFGQPAIQRAELEEILKVPDDLVWHLLCRTLLRFLQVRANRKMVLEGSDDLFAIRCKILKEIEQEEKGSLKGAPLPKKFSVNFSKNSKITFENKE